MNTQTGPHGNRTRIAEPRPWLEVMLIYEDFTTGLRARRLFDQAVDPLNLEIDFRVSLWRFDLLREPGLFERVVEEAAQADIVLLSAHGQDGLPPAVDLWLSRWLLMISKSTEPRMLGVSLDLCSRKSTATHRRLEALRAEAVAAGVEVLVHTAEPLETEWESASREVRRREEARMNLEQRAEPFPYRRWGINE